MRVSVPSRRKTLNKLAKAKDATLRRRVRDLLSKHFPPALSWYRAVRTEVHGVQGRLNRRNCGTYVAVTGSCGKSTTVHLLGRLFAKQGSTNFATQRNMRSAVFRRLAKLSAPTDYVVQEVSGHHPGAIASVAGVMRHDIAVVTAVGSDHLSSFKEAAADEGGAHVADRVLASVAREKRVLVETLRPGGIACLNADDPRVRAMSASAPGRVVLFGVGADAELRAENVTARWPERLSFDLVVGTTRHRVRTRFVGTLMLPSILAALTAVHASNADLGRAVADLAHVNPFRLRMNVGVGTDGHTYVVDTFKAPLWQVERLIDDLPNLGAGPVVLVLGEVSDTRTDKSSIYRKLLRRASEVATQVVGFGPAASSANKVRAAGYGNVIGLETYGETLAYLATLPPSLIILKSNRSVKLGTVWEMVKPAPAGDGKAAELTRG